MTAARSTAARVVEIETPAGPARAHLHDASGAPRATVVLGHGAGGGIEARDLVALAQELPRAGVRVVLVEQPWRVAGKKLAPAPKTLDVGWIAVMDRLRADGLLAGPVIVGGRSAGARVACRTAVGTGADAALLLAFPLHPPGKPDRMRTDELTGAGVPLRVLQGGRDPFGTPAEFAAAAPGTPVTEVPHGDHGFAVAKSAPVTQLEALEVIVGAARASLAEWVPARGR